MLLAVADRRAGDLVDDGEGYTLSGQPRADSTHNPSPYASPEYRLSSQASLWLPPLLLCISNIFMTFAWYGHLKFTDKPLWLVILASWSIAFIEYCFAIPANRIGHQAYSAAELKTMQEVITLLVFAAFSVLYLKESLTWNHAIGFGLIALGAFFIFKGPIGG